MGGLCQSGYTIKVSRSGRQQSCCNQRGRPVGNYLKPKVFPVGASTCANPGDAKKVIAGRDGGDCCAVDLMFGGDADPLSATRPERPTPDHLTCKLFYG
jgi:hypothetical protein